MCPAEDFARCFWSIGQAEQLPMSEEFKFRDVLYKLLIVLLTSTVIVWLSVFLYGTFYYTYMPAVSHIKPAHLHFSWCPRESICSFPSANITLVKKGQEQLLMRGQQYKVYLDLEMPESPVNQKLGMFMVKIAFSSRSGEVVHTSLRSAMLRYKSSLLQTISTVFFTPLLLMGSAEEKQLLSVELCDFYEEDATRPATTVHVEVQSKNVEIYSSQLRIYAHFTGLRYLMFHWPVLSAIVGIGTNLFFLSIVALLSWYRYLVSHESHEVVVRVGFDDSRMKTIEERRSQVKEFLLREKQRQTRMRASFSSFERPGGAPKKLLQESLGRTHSLESFPTPSSKELKEGNVSSRTSSFSGSPVRKYAIPLSKLALSDQLMTLKLKQSKEADINISSEKGIGSDDGTQDDDNSIDQDSINGSFTLGDLEDEEPKSLDAESAGEDSLEKVPLDETQLRSRQFVEKVKQ